MTGNMDLTQVVTRKRHTAARHCSVPPTCVVDRAEQDSYRGAVS